MPSQPRYPIQIHPGAVAMSSRPMTMPGRVARPTMADAGPKQRGSKRECRDARPEGPGEGCSERSESPDPDV